MDAIVFLGVLEALPQEARDALTREALKRGVPVEEIICEGLIEMADAINGHRLPEREDEAAA